MLFRQKQEARVTTKEQLDAALKSADRIVVEGDDELLSYAISEAASDKENNISVQLGWAPAPMQAPTESNSASTNSGPSQLDRDERQVLRDEPAESHRTLPRSSIFSSFAYILWGVAAVVAFFVVVVIVGYSSIKADFQSPGVIVDGPPPSSIEHASRPDGSAGATDIVKALSWPVVAVIAICALFFIARQAIAGGRNLEVRWAITEKVTGRLVITKQRSPPIRVSKKASS